MRYRRLQTLGFAALLATLTAIHCIPTEVQADRRRRWTTYGSDRGRLVVACDMRSDTCSDGRKITTVRASPVPCETSPGVWQTIPEDTGCYSVRGLEAWAANTSYANHGADLTKWIKHPDMTLEVLDPQGFRLTGLSSGADINSGFVSALEGERWTAACFMREAPLGPASISLRAGNVAAVSPCEVTPGVSWEVHSCTHVRSADGSGALFIHTRTSSVDVLACWSTKASTPGRPCWGGEAPVTCAAGRHTISTDGWPTESGEIRMVVELNEQLVAGKDAWLFDGRDTPNLIGVNPFIQSNGRLRFRVGETAYGPESPMLNWAVGRPYALRFLREGGRTYIYRDGALVYSAATPDWAWAPSAHLGMNFSLSGPGIAMNIRSFTVRSYKEESP